MSAVSDFNASVIDEFRSNHGQVGGQFTGAPMILVTTTGAKSGKPRTKPLVYLADGDRMVVFASNAGAPTNPDWYHNLVAHRRVTVEAGDEAFDAVASVAEGEERERLFAQQVAAMPGFADYLQRTDRVIPVVVLTRA